jgi:outer membrane protein assembly factor BamB
MSASVDRRRLAVAGCWTAAACIAVAAAGFTRAAEDDPDVDPQTEDDPTVLLPTDRIKERQFDRLGRLFADARWSDAAALCDEILESSGDVFIRDEAAASLRSLKSAVAQLLARQPARGREAYDLLFAARAERELQAAIAADDRDGVAAVARRWLQTPAGGQAAIILAIAALETDQPAVALGWLARLEATGGDRGLPPGLKTLQARARGGAGGRAADTGVPAHAPLARNLVVAASRPLLAPRYRVRLARDAAEAAALERRRRARADRAADHGPAAMPLVVDGTVVVRAPIGLVAIDFETGKRRWIRPRRGTVVGMDDSLADDPLLAATFDDGVGAGLSAGPGLVVAVEPATAGPVDDGSLPADVADRADPNALVAYDSSTGAERWRLPTAASRARYLGPPLAVGDELLVMVEDKGLIRMDAVAAATGTVRWSQPLVELDDVPAAGDTSGPGRRLAGLAPALAEGILVCPLGAGVVVSLDMATRTLLWAFRYDRLDEQERADAVAAAPRPVPRTGDGPRDGWPVIAGGRVLVTPPDSDRLVCLDLRSGEAAWREHPGGRLRVGGATAEAVVAIGRSGVEARSLVDGTRLWHLGHDAAGGRPSGRGILTPTGFLVPLDTGAVIEVCTTSGTVVGRSPARHDVVPGNLVAHRDAILAQGPAALDVFHQLDPLERRVAAALRADPTAAWALAWRGQLSLDHGNVTAGLAALRSAALAPTPLLAPGSLAVAVLAGLDRDFAAAVTAWPEAWQAETAGRALVTPAARAMVRAVIDGFLDRRDAARAWQACRALLEADSGDAIDDLVTDPRDRSLTVTEGRWLGGRLGGLVALGDESLRREIDATTRAVVDAAAARPAPLAPLERVAAMLGRLPAAADARRRVVSELDTAIARDGDATGRLAVRRDVHLVALLRHDDAAARAFATERLAAAQSGTPPPADWPLGRVIARRIRTPTAEARDLTIAHRAPVPLTGDHPVPPDLAVAHDPQHGSLLVLDRYGRRLVEPLPIDASSTAVGIGWQPLPFGPEASCLGRLLVVDGGSTVAAHSLAAAGSGGRCLWWRPRTAARARELGGTGRRPGSETPHGGMLLSDRLSGTGGPPPARVPRGTVARATGVLHLDGRTLLLLDPTTGRVLWERRRLPPGATVFGDDEVACAAVAEAAPAQVFSMEDGRSLRTIHLPPPRARLGTVGRWVVAVAPGPASTARIEMLDPASGDRVTLGEVDARSRAIQEAGRLLTLDPSGRLVAFDLDRRAEAWRVQLPEMPATCDFLHVVARPGRLLVVAGDAAEGDGSAAQDGADFFTARPWPAASDATRPLTAAVWAIDDSTGAPLWPAPATVAGFALHTAQPAGLPLLLFSRSGPAALGAPRQRLQLLGLDTRTGHAVLDDGGLPVQGVEFGWALRGYPERRTVELRDAVGNGRRIVLDYTLAPLAPQPPHRSTGARRPIVGPDALAPAVADPAPTP